MKTLDEILEMVAAEGNYDKWLIRSNSRHYQPVMLRNMFVKLCLLSGYRRKTIANYLGRERSVTYNAEKSIQNMIDTDCSWKMMFELLLSRVVDLNPVISTQQLNVRPSGNKCLIV